MKISTKKTRSLAIIVLTILITSMFMLIVNVPVQAQTQEGGSVPLPSGVTPKYLQNNDPCSSPKTSIISY